MYVITYIYIYIYRQGRPEPSEQGSRRMTFEAPPEPGDVKTWLQ